MHGIRRPLATSIASVATLVQHALNSPTPHQISPVPAFIAYACNNSFLLRQATQTISMNPVVLAVDDLREQYLKEMALVRQTCERTGDGTAAIRRRSAVVDRILIEMWRRAFADLPAQNVALLALGGYGRKDLFPYSDIDVLFAFADDKTEEQSREAVRAIIQGMWDIGLRASPSSRTVKEAGRFDPDNLEFTLATLDRRFLAGQFPLYQQLHQVTFPGLVLSEWNDHHAEAGRDRPRPPRQVRQHHLSSRAQPERLPRRPARLLTSPSGSRCCSI